MVIIISGPSSSGKTLLAQKLLEINKITYYSIDHIKMGIYRGNLDCGFNPLDEDSFIAKKLWPVLKGIIMTALENEQNLVLEGAYILPKHIYEFDEVYRNQIIPIFFGFSESYVRDNFYNGILSNRNVIEIRKYEEDRSLEWFVKTHFDFVNKCANSGIDYFLIEKDYEIEMEKIYEYINFRIKEVKK